VRSDHPPLTSEDRAKKLAELYAWRQRQQALARQSHRRSGTTRNDARWGIACRELYGTRCVVCGDANTEMDHIIPRSQGGPSVLENGLPLCGAWSSTVDGGHHGMKTAGALKIKHEWLTPAQVEFLSKSGWVTWDENGQPVGRGWRHFAPKWSTLPPGLATPAGGA
jgi:hypothetical protein